MCIESYNIGGSIIGDILIRRIYDNMELKLYTEENAIHCELQMCLKTCKYRIREATLCGVCTFPLHWYFVYSKKIENSVENTAKI